MKKYVVILSIFFAGAWPFAFAKAAITLVNNLGVVGNASVTTAPTTTSPGSVAVLCLSTSNGLPPAVSDSFGNTWKRISVDQFTNAGALLELYYAVLSTTGTNHTFTVNANPFTSNLGVAVGIFSGVSTSTPLDASSTSSGTSITPSSGNVTTTVQNDLLVGCNTHDGSLVTSIGSGFASVYGNDATSSAQPVSEEYKILSGTPVTSSVWTLSQSNSWAAVAGALAPASAGGGGGGTLSCTVAASCPTGVVLFNIAKTTGSHAELSSQSNYGNVVCCTGVVGLGNSCSGTFAGVLNLQKTTNSHVEEAPLSNYSNKACISVAAGTVFTGYQNNNCNGWDTTIGSISATTNAHVGDANAYNIKICASGLAAVTTLTEDHYGWYANADGVTPGSALAAADTATSNIASAAKVRLRMNIAATGGNLNAASQAFKLQYATSTGGPWNDVGNAASSTVWRGFDNPTPADGATLSGSPLVTSSTVLESYEENEPSVSNPNAIAAGNWGEWDWVLQNNGAANGTTYFFRMVKSSGITLDAYSRYPSLTTQVTHAASGSLVSDIIDTAITGGVAPNSVAFQGIEPANTSVQFQFAAATSTAGPWNYVAWNPATLSCDSSSFYTPPDANGSQVEIKAACYNNKRYIRYKVFLSTSDPTITPEVDRVILNYGQ